MFWQMHDAKSQYPEPRPRFLTPDRVPRVFAYAAGFMFSYIRSVGGLMKIAAFPALAVLEGLLGAACIQGAELGSLVAVEQRKQAWWARAGVVVVMLASILLSLHAWLDDAEYLMWQTVFRSGFGALEVKAVFGLLVNTFSAVSVDFACFVLAKAIAADLVTYWPDWKVWYSGKTAWENEQRKAEQLHQERREARRESREWKRQQGRSSTEHPPNEQTAPADEAARRERLVNFLRTNGRTHVDELIEQVDVERTTVYGDIRALKEAGQIVQAGRGWYATPNGHGG